jgi:hypothetical protein
MSGMNTFNDNDTQVLIGLIEGVGGEGITTQRSRGGGASIKHVFPPAGGISAATWNASTETMTPGIGSCRIAKYTSGQYSPTTDTVLVENPVGAVVGISGKPMTIGKNTSGAWTVLVEDCSGSSVDDTGGPLPDPEDPLNPEFTLSLEL